MTEEELFQHWCDNEWKFRSSIEHIGTGVHVRIKVNNGKWESVDISKLEPESLLSWLHSRKDKV